VAVSAKRFGRCNQRREKKGALLRVPLFIKLLA
jgi:hypothetical protein